MLGLVSAGLGEAGPVKVVQLLGGGRGEVVDGFVGSFGVEPGEPVQDYWFEVVPVAPGAVRVEQLGFEQADPRFGQGVVVRWPADATEGSMPISASRLVNAIEVYWLPAMISCLSSCGAGRLAGVLRHAG
jgi:hypothetical protein